MADPLRENIRRVTERIVAASERAGRDPAEVVLVAVTKTVTAERVEEAIRAGLRVLGENRVQEAREKIASVRLPAEWHLVGHLQSNKARLAAGLFRLIHSLDGPELARRLDRACAEAGCRVEALVQVNVSGEASKSGLPPAGLREALEKIAACPQVRVRGLMTIPPWESDPEKSRPHFAALRRLREEAREWGVPGIGLGELSMGMSDDYAVAIEEGATLVRIGRAIFGDRP